MYIIIDHLPYVYFNVFYNKYDVRNKYVHQCNVNYMSMLQTVHRSSTVVVTVVRYLCQTKNFCNSATE